MTILLASLLISIVGVTVRAQTLPPIPNDTMLANDSGSTAPPSGIPPTSFWDTFCANTIGYIWVRMSGGWACSPSFDAPVTWWGAKCDGSTNDTSAINTAIASGIKSIAIVGTCDVTTLSQLPTNFTLHGQNWNNSYLQTTSATGDVITAAYGDQIRDLGFTSTVTRTSGDFIHIGGGANSTNVGNVALSHLYFTNYYNAIELNNAQLVRGTDILMPGASWSHDGILLDGASGSGQPYNTDIVFTGLVVTGGANGIEGSAIGDASFIRLEVFSSGNGIILDPNGSAASGNNIQFFACSTCILDSNSSVGLNISASNGAGIYTVKLVDSWIATNTLYGVELSTDNGHGSAINETDLLDDIIANNTCGVVLNNSTNAINTSIIGSAIAGNSGLCNAGLWIGTGTIDLRVVGSKIGPSSEFGANGIGINFQASSGTACAGCEFVDNDLSGNNTSVNITAGIPITGFIANNIGYHSGTPSLSSCGSGTISGNDYGGTVSNSGNNCTVNFANLFQIAPVCVWQDLTSTRTGMGTTNATNGMAVGGLTTGDNFAYQCRPDPGN